MLGNNSIFGWVLIRFDSRVLDENVEAMWSGKSRFIATGLISDFLMLLISRDSHAEPLSRE